MKRLIVLLFLFGLNLSAFAGSLTGKTPAQTYKDLLFLDNNNDGLTSTLLYLKSGNGVASPLGISTTKVNVQAGAFQIGGVDLPSPIGTVTSFSAVANDGLTASVLNSLTTPQLTIGVNAITVAKGGTGTSTVFTDGSILFAGASGIYSQNNSLLFWDRTNNRFGLGTNTPAVKFHQLGTAYIGGVTTDQDKHLHLEFNEASDIGKIFAEDNGTAYKDLVLNYDSADTAKFVGIGKLPTSKLDVNGVTTTGGLETTFINASGNITAQGDLTLGTVTKGIKIKEGSNARMGVCTLAAGTCTVANNLVNGTTRIFLTNNTPGGTVGFLRISARVVSTSFTISSSSATDTSTIAWLLIEPSP